MYWVFHNKVLNFKFSLFLFLQLEVDYRVAEVVLKVLKVEFRELLVVEKGFLNLSVGMDCAIL